MDTSTMETTRTDTSGNFQVSPLLQNEISSSEQEKMPSAAPRPKNVFPLVLLIQFFFILFSSGRGVDGYLNHPPMFLIDGQTEIILRLKEGNETPAGTLIYRLRGFDVDGDPLSFGVKEHLGNEILNIEKVGSNEANVYLKKELDREERDEYGFILTLTDGRLGDGNFITQCLLILVEDVNDNEPVFKQYQSTVVLPEDSPPGVVLTVEATDRDEGTYGQVIYRIEKSDKENDLFTISTVNGKGVIKLVGELDYEKKFLYQLKILAVDRSNSGRVNTGTAAVIIKVDDVEDQLPEFLNVSPVSRIGEDAPLGTQITRVKAVDGDRGINNPIIYSLTKGALGIFAIDPDLGIIYTIKKLDRESPNNNYGAYILEVTAEERSKSSPFLSSSVKTEVTIIVTDVNDEIPTFRSPFYEGEINENAQVNTPVSFRSDFLPEVYDHDQSNNGTFQMFLEGGEDIFEVTPSMGINEASFLIRVKDPLKLDYEKINYLNFTIVAKEMVPLNPKYSRASVVVHVRDINDNGPVFVDSPYRISVPENAKKGMTITRIRATDDDSGAFGTEGVRFTALSGSMADSLALDENTGIITIVSERPLFDREFIERHYLTVEAADDFGRGNRNVAQLIIDVEDGNDNAPKFFQTKYEARLLENHLEFENPLIVEAHDQDLNGTENSKIVYEIVAGNEDYDYFEIDSFSGLIHLKRHVDFEELASEKTKEKKGEAKSSVRALTLVVRARDQGTPSLASEVPVVVYVSDMNDHAPTFEHPSYAITIPETLLSESSIMRVTATDNDASSPNCDIVYRIQKGAKDKFVIDAETGIIKVAPGASLDPDQTHPPSTRYSLTVLAIDGGIGADRLQTSVEVNVTIKDVNNKAPIFKDPGVVRIKEDAKVGEYLLRVMAVDQDTNPILRYRLDANESEARNEDGTFIKSSELDFVNYFDLNPVDGIIRIRKTIDREKVETIKLVIVCEDVASTNGVQEAFTVVIVLIEDVNDNSPVFRRPFYKRSITENSKNGVGIANVVADDPDKNRTIKYSLEGSKAIIGLVHLDPDTGEIIVANKIDYELTPWLNFSVKATDSGFPPRSSLVDVFVQVIDENDNNPFFLEHLTNLTVREDTPIGKEILKIEAMDLDSGDFGKITYFLDRISSKGKFRIDAESGTISVADTLDRENQSFFLLVIEAWDNYQFGFGSGEARNAFKQIGITIVDVNDETPRFEPIENCASVTEYHGVGETITVVKAYDDDDPLTLNGRMTFAIVGGNEKNIFRIENSDYDSARIVASTSLKGFYGNFTLIVRARDLGTPSNYAEASVPICVTDFNDNTPVFVRPERNTTVKVPENATVGTTLIQVFAVDADFGGNGAVRYRLRKDPLGNWKTFSIDDFTGDITLARPLDKERQKIYELRVEAYDLGVPTSLSSDLDLTIHVKNINDFEPQFLVNEMFINFTEHEEPGLEKRTLINAIDKDDLDEDEDEDASGGVCFFIVGGNEKGHFSLEPSTHELTVKKPLDREENDRHALVIKATEDCVYTPPSKEVAFDDKDDTLLKVLIKVNDVNDHPPRFVKKIFTGGVTTNADFGTEFMKIKAVDKDEGKNGEIKYYQVGKTVMSLTEDMETVREPPFLIDEKTGSLILNFYPRKSMKGYFQLTVLANDTGGLEDTAGVHIYLLRKDQRVRFVLRQHPSELRERIDAFRDELKEVTGALVNVDEFKVHENKDGTFDGTKTDLYLHFVNPNDNAVVDVRDVLHVVDQNIERLDALFKDFNVLDTQPAEALKIDDVTDKGHVVWLVGIIIFLSIMQILVLVLCFSQRSKYKRAIKAATATAFGSERPDVERTVRHVPNTNMHSVEGSNPIWMKACENEWYGEEESSSQNSEKDSLDNNVVTDDDRITQGTKCFDKGSAENATYVSASHVVSALEKNKRYLTETDTKSKNNQENLPQNLIIASNLFSRIKKMETTEL